MMDVDNFQRGRELLFDHHHFLDERETPSSEMKVYGGSDYKQGWRFPEGEGNGFVESRTIEAGLVSSSETTEEDDDYIAELTRQMTQYMLQDDDKHALKTSITSSEKNGESWGRVGWPSDSATIWSPLGSSSGSPEGPSQEPSPPVTPGNKDQASEHKSPPSYAAVLCKLDKLETNKQGNPSGTTQVAEAENPKQGVAFDQSQDSKIKFKLKQGKSSKKRNSTKNGTQPKHITHQEFESYNQKEVGSCVNGGLRPPLPMANFPWLNNQQGPSDMRAAFHSLSGSGSRVGTPSCGTGVFLPCVIGNTSQSSKNKRGCSPVLIPAKVVQALKVHFDRVGELPRQNPTAFPIQNDSSKGGRRTSTLANRKRHPRGTAPPDMNNNEITLPQEWTY
ncbi:uncharacterized protein LOC126788006 isoform X2 [Argentina anserina]|uniref:uncharacterized protein LOC126788006 isoform X2 n=1 Tax=Argentina anserina TaxID=57926 RepID=UPI0021763E37|nr:uncharacterized protein LOC126788006 isoform X2 [Potentilla anserina]